jgi:hypothetical protein
MAHTQFSPGVRLNQSRRMGAVFQGYGGHFLRVNEPQRWVDIVRTGRARISVTETQNGGEDLQGTYPCVTADPFREMIVVEQIRAEVAPQAYEHE